jgi:hypothetical protein
LDLAHVPEYWFGTSTCPEYSPKPASGRRRNWSECRFRLLKGNLSKHVSHSNLPVGSETEEQLTMSKTAHSGPGWCECYPFICRIIFHQALYFASYCFIRRNNFSAGAANATHQSGPGSRFKWRNPNLILNQTGQFTRRQPQASREQLDNDLDSYMSQSRGYLNTNFDRFLQ